MNYRWNYEENGMFTLYAGETAVLTAYARAADTRLGSLDTRAARLIRKESGKSNLLLVFRNAAGLELYEYLSVRDDKPFARCELRAKDGSYAESNDLRPLIMRAKNDYDSPYLWRGLQSKMLLIPYDNDMWSRYEAAAFSAGRRSADMTVLFSEETREGILIGAIDFDVWKNAVACSAHDCRTLEARCGYAASGENTHDFLEHRTMTGECVASSEFVVLYGPDFRELLEQYGDLIRSVKEPRTWEEGIPFGYNTYAALGIDLDEEKYRQCGTFIREELMKNNFENGGTTYINLDGGWRDIDREAMLQVKEEYLKKGQQAGIYDSPFAYWGGDLDAVIPYLEEKHTFREIVLKNEQGEPLPPLDTAYAYDVTHPVWKKWTKQKAALYIEWGFSFLKIDFLSHAGLEAWHYDANIRTGRQALNEGYRFFESLYLPEVCGRPFFISLSIAPLFPCGYGNARRFSCDCFGLSEDIEYGLNAQTFCWWNGGRLYQYNDADHIVLHKAFTMPRKSREGEARARYTAAAISGGLMILSDNYADSEARERTAKLAVNHEVNEIAASGTAFRPVETAGGSAGHVFTAVIHEVPYVAVFNWNGGESTEGTTCIRAQVPEGIYRDLWSGTRICTDHGQLIWRFTDTDAVLLKYEGPDRNTIF
ncbi:MAG: hypothetical protein IJJ25_10145 [Lachnospiraceae bacterium]|nr:hypothetical protein [Lachnospiraceae bacterium]